MCNCSIKAIERGYLHSEFYSKVDDNAYTKKYFIRVALPEKKLQDVLIKYCPWCGEKYQDEQPRKLTELTLNEVKYD